MSKSFILDTETTGLVDFKKPSEDPCQPRVTQIACELVDDDTRQVLAGMHCLIKPDGWTIPPELEEKIGITTAMCQAHGLPMAVVLPSFIQMWLLAEQRVAHNCDFDSRMIRIELMRCASFKSMMMNDAPFADFWKSAKSFCTMQHSKPIIKLPATGKMHAAGFHGYKQPNLSEAYLHFTGQKLEGAHDAAVDVMACKTVYFAIKDHRAREAA